MIMEVQYNLQEERNKFQRFTKEVAIPMDLLHGQEGLAFWSYWDDECKAHELWMRLVASKFESKTEELLNEQLQWLGKPYTKIRDDMLEYINSGKENAICWRRTRERMHYLLTKRCARPFHAWYCCCPNCFGIFHVKGSPTMIIVQIKSVIYELRQFNDKARVCLLDMLKASDIQMMGFQDKGPDDLCDGYPIVVVLSSQKAEKKFCKYDYSQEVITSLILTLDD